METSTRLLAASAPCGGPLTRHLRGRSPLPSVRSCFHGPLSLPKLQLYPRNGRRAVASAAAATRFFPSPPPRKPFLSLSSSQAHSLRHERSDLANRFGPEADSRTLPLDRGGDGAGRGDLGFWGGGKAGSWTVVLLGWLGAEERHLRRYEEMYGARGVRAVRFVVPVKDTVGLDLCRSVEGRIGALAEELAGWCAEGEREGKERHLVFHTFSNTGWLAFGVLLQNFQSRNGILEKIKGCIVDSAPAAEISPKVWAAGYCAAILKKRNPTSVELLEKCKVDGRTNRLDTQGIISSLIGVIVFKAFEIFFSLALMLPYANQRLSSIISTLKNQPPCPQLYLYSSADKVIPASTVESFIKEQKALGRIVHAHDFVSSPHVDHYRNFPHIYSAKVYEFLEHCCSTVVSKP